MTRIPASAFAKLAMAAAAYHAVVFLTLHVLEPELSPVSSIISDYTATAAGGVATSAFVAFAVVWASLAAALAASQGTRLLLVGRVMLALAVIGILVGVASPASADPRTGSLPASAINLVARPGLFAAVLLASLGLRGAKGWEDRVPLLLTISIVACALLVVTIALLLENGFGGLGQRTLFVLLYAWVFLVATRITRGHRAGRPDTIIA